jgi:hypothetical protein
VTARTAVGLLAALAGFGSVILSLVLLHALRRRRLLSATGSLLGALLLATIALLAGVILVGTRGYAALTREERAALVWTVPTGDARFVAHVRLNDGSLRTFRMAGDALYVDAHILKWRPVVNLFGLHTAYELDRIAGRYESVEEERSRQRTVYALAPARAIDLFDLRRRWPVLAPLVDAEYGSATFVAVKDTSAWEILVSPTGLLARPASVAALRESGTGGD